MTDIACGALNGLKMGDKTLTVRRATAKLVSFKSNATFFFFQLFLAHIGLNPFVMVFTAACNLNQSKKISWYRHNSI